MVETLLAKVFTMVVGIVLAAVALWMLLGVWIFIHSRLDRRRLRREWQQRDRHLATLRRAATEDPSSMSAFESALSDALLYYVEAREMEDWEAPDRVLVKELERRIRSLRFELERLRDATRARGAALQSWNEREQELANLRERPTHSPSDTSAPNTDWILLGDLEVRQHALRSELDRLQDEATLVPHRLNEEEPTPDSPRRRE